MNGNSIGLARRVLDILRISEWKDQIMTAMDELTAAVKVAETKMDAAAVLIPQLQSSVSNLRSQIAAMPDNSAVVESLITELNQHVANLTAVLPAQTSTNSETAADSSSSSSATT